MIKKTFTYLFLLTLLFSKVNAQDSKPSKWCGTKLSKEQLDWLDEYQRNDASEVYRKKSTYTAYVPIKAHIVGKDDGSGYYDLKKLFDDVCELNMRYDRDSIGIHFFLYEDIDYINNTAFYNDGSQTNPMANSIMNSSLHHRSGALNMFFVAASPGLCGYFSPGLDVVVIIGACGGHNATTVAHEVGHYFSLPHTFHGWEGVWDAGCDTLVNTGESKPSNPEKVDRSNCQVAGDKFCDTKADYNPDRWGTGTGCSYRYCNLRKDPNGVPVWPDSSLYMSYADDICVSRFSHEQRGAMQANYNTVRSGYLLNQAQNFNAVTGTTTLITPNTSDTPPADFVSCSWNSVPGATKYCVAIYKQNTSSNQVWSVMTTDTFAAFYANANLVENVLYNIRVMAYNPGKPCGTFSAPVQFSPSAATGINTISSVSSFKIYPNPVNNYFIVNYISETTVGNYTLTVFDISGKQVYNKQIAANGRTEVVETSNWTSGEYFVQLRNADNKILKTEKVIVSK
ncbi:MAG: hypothetical protein RI955_501 [Bacteroidota bacterium]|jgi:hypothetical protein